MTTALAHENPSVPQASAPQQLVLIAHAGAERDRYLALLAQNRRLYLDTVRGVAREIALREGTVDIDRVRALMPVRGIPLPAEVGYDARCLGALFAKDEWEVVGSHLTTRQERIARAGAGSSLVYVYRLRSAA